MTTLARHERDAGGPRRPRAPRPHVGRSGGRHERTDGSGDGPFVGLGLTTGLALRTSRWFWLVWVLVLALLMPATASAFRTIIPDGPSGVALAETLGLNPTMRAMLGPPYDLLHAGSFTMWRVGTFVAAGAAMMAALGVIRATRAEEENGRTELLRSGVVGRHAVLGGALLVALGACLVLGLVVTVTMAAVAPPLTGALAAGLGIAATGAVWAGVGAVAAQLSSSARSARGLALGSLGVAYLLRALADAVPGDSAMSSLRWLSPVEWAALSRPYAGERWWVLLLPGLTTLALVALAVVVEAHRDHGAGVRADRPGPARGAASLASPAALAWRLARGSIIGWSIGVLLSAVAIGSLVGSVQTLLSDNPRLAQMFAQMGRSATAGGDLRDAFYVAMLGILLVVLACLAATLALRIRPEEQSGRAELLLATATTRTRYLLAWALPALVVPSVLLVLTGAALAVPQALTGSGSVLPMAGAAAALLPGLWLVVGLVVALLGWAPRATWLVWGVLGWSLFLTWVGALLRLPEALLQVTPFAPLPHLPVESFSWAPVLTITALAAALLGLGVLGFRRRDIGVG